jgi:hypothetical protein
MMAEFDDVVTDRQLSRRLAEQHLAASARRAGLLLDEYVCLVSGAARACAASSCRSWASSPISSPR